MKRLIQGVFLAAAMMLAVGPAVAADKVEKAEKKAEKRAAKDAAKADCAQPSASVGSQSTAPAPEKISGTVTNLDHGTNMVTVRTESGQSMQFRGDPETVKDLKVGDRLDLNKRAASAQNC